MAREFTDGQINQLVRDIIAQLELYKLSNQKINQFLTADATTDIDTGGGETIPSLRKVIAEALAATGGASPEQLERIATNEGNIILLQTAVDNLQTADTNITNSLNLSNYEVRLFYIATNEVPTRSGYPRYTDANRFITNAWTLTIPTPNADQKLYAIISLYNPTQDRYSGFSDPFDLSQPVATAGISDETLQQIQDNTDTNATQTTEISNLADRITDAVVNIGINTGDIQNLQTDLNNTDAANTRQDRELDSIRSVQSARTTTINNLTALVNQSSTDIANLRINTQSGVMRIVALYQASETAPAVLPRRINTDPYIELRGWATAVPSVPEDSNLYISLTSFNTETNEYINFSNPINISGAGGGSGVPQDVLDDISQALQDILTNKGDISNLQTDLNNTDAANTRQDRELDSIRAVQSSRTIAINQLTALVNQSVTDITNLRTNTQSGVMRIVALYQASETTPAVLPLRTNTDPYINLRGWATAVPAVPEDSNLYISLTSFNSETNEYINFSNPINISGAGGGSGVPQNVLADISRALTSIGVIEGDITAIKGVNTTQNTDINNLTTQQETNTEEITNIKGVNTTQGTDIFNLKNQQATNTQDITGLKTTETAQNNRLNALESNGGGGSVTQEQVDMAVAELIENTDDISPVNLYLKYIDKTTSQQTTAQAIPDAPLTGAYTGTANTGIFKETFTIIPDTTQIETDTLPNVPFFTCWEGELSISGSGFGGTSRIKITQNFTHFVGTPNERTDSREVVIRLFNTTFNTIPLNIFSSVLTLSKEQTDSATTPFRIGLTIDIEYMTEGDRFTFTPAAIPSGSNFSLRFVKPGVAFYQPAQLKIGSGGGTGLTAAQLMELTQATANNILQDTSITNLETEQAELVKKTSKIEVIENPTFMVTDLAELALIPEGDAITSGNYAIGFMPTSGTYYAALRVRIETRTR